MTEIIANIKLEPTVRKHIRGLFIRSYVRMRASYINGESACVFALRSLLPWGST